MQTDGWRYLNNPNVPDVAKQYMVQTCRPTPAEKPHPDADAIDEAGLKRFEAVMKDSAAYRAMVGQAHLMATGPGQLEATYQVVWRERQDTELLGLSAGLGGGAKPGGGQGRTVGLTSKSGAGVKAVEGTPKVVNGFNAIVHVEKQGKHIPGHPNYQPGKSIFTGDAQKLLDKFAGKGEWIGQNKERVDFGEIIGKYVDPTTGNAVETTKGIIHYSKNGAHIVPARP